MKRGLIMRYIVKISLSLFFLLSLFIGSLFHVEGKTKVSNKTGKTISNSVDKERSFENEMKKLDNETIFLLTDKFMNHLVQETDQDYKVKKYHSKNELIESFSSIASKEVAKKFVDVYYKETGGNLYIIPTETPPWFTRNQSYKLDKINETETNVTQLNSSELYGDYKIEITFQWVKDHWIIKEVSYDEDFDQVKG
jgi:hypothetical protein